jgi:hypothetical protein
VCVMRLSSCRERFRFVKSEVGSGEWGEKEKWRY